MEESGGVERRVLCQILHRALVEIRFVASQGKSQQAADLADVMHNIPAYLDSSEFNWDLAEAALRAYQHKYPRAEGDEYFDYVALGASTTMRVR